VTSLSVRAFLAANHFSLAVGVRRLLPMGQSSLRQFLATTPFAPDRLRANQQLKTDEQLVSNNGYLNLKVQPDGDVVLFRSMFGTQLWSTSTISPPAVLLLMQSDGNLVALSSAGATIWSSGTAGADGAYCALQDDGNFVIYNASGAALWASNTVQDFRSPAYVYQASDSYTYDETSETWKELCRALPCFDALQWPDYSTTHVDATINGQAVVIQLWKGWCEKFLGLNEFPGGVGAEVGIYRRMPGRARPTSLPFVPSWLESLILSSIKTLTDDELWWPFPELGAVVEYTLTNPKTGLKFFSAGPEATYWLAKWMFDDSYAKYVAAQGIGRTPILSADYALEYRVGGISFPVW
jgi:hypothetical protein